MRPLYSIRPSLRKRFMKKLTRDRVVPTISARVSCVMGGMKGFRFTRLTKFGHQQENSRQTLFAGVEKLIDKIGLGSHTPGQQEFQEHFGEGMLLVHHADHLLPRYLERCTNDNGRGSGHVQPTHARQRLLSNEFPGGEKRDVASLPSGETTVSFARPVRR
jgi:hypothetical protein